ncbi:MAG: hypothetical protein J7494_05045 [Sphingobium sp.]|nr:hypothetical protein [Sphingobium sp.]
MSARKTEDAGIRRRELLGGAALLGAAGAVGVARILPRAGEAGVVIFDGARPASRAFAKGSAAPRRIDLAQDASSNWRALRTLRKGERVAGFTPWGAYVSARGWLEEQGLRLVSEQLDRRTGLIAWTMA